MRKAPDRMVQGFDGRYSSPECRKSSTSARGHVTHELHAACHSEHEAPSTCGQRGLVDAASAAGLGAEGRDGLPDDLGDLFG